MTLPETAVADYTPAVNLLWSQREGEVLRYVATPNVRAVVQRLDGDYAQGQRVFLLIGSYGCGKSSFLRALQREAGNTASKLLDKGRLFAHQHCHFLGVVGDYAPAWLLIAERLGMHNAEGDAVIAAVAALAEELAATGTLLCVVFDELGKVLEHAAGATPEAELYFLQKLAEAAAAPRSNFLLIGTLHQHFGAYSSRLSRGQRDEWEKVRGRFDEVPFHEPVEQLLTLTAAKLKPNRTLTEEEEVVLKNSLYIYIYICEFNNVCDRLTPEAARTLYPLEPLAATCLARAVQRHGQNQRTLLSLLTDPAEAAWLNFDPHGGLLALSRVHDLLLRRMEGHTESGPDVVQWQALRRALARIGSGVAGVMRQPHLEAAVKVIGLLNIFFPSLRVERAVMLRYLKQCEADDAPADTLTALENASIVRWADYRGAFILYEGSDVNLEAELALAAEIVPAPELSAQNIAPYVTTKVWLAAAAYILTGTPRFFQLIVSNEPTTLTPRADIDGFVNLVVQANRDVVIHCADDNKAAIVYVLLNDTTSLLSALHAVAMLRYVREHAALDDRVAQAEIDRQIAQESRRLNEALDDLPRKDNATWIVQGKVVKVGSLAKFNRLLSQVCKNVYPLTPILRSELINHERVSSAVSLARGNLFTALCQHADEPLLGLPQELWPPEKSIYVSLLLATGIHRQASDGSWQLGEPTSDDFLPVWTASITWLHTATEAPRPINELDELLQAAPYKLKRGVIDCWVPIFLYIQRDNVALYFNGAFVVDVTRETLELLHRGRSKFTVRSYRLGAEAVAVFNEYRRFLGQEGGEVINQAALLATIRPFLRFYRQLPPYTLQTNRFAWPSAARLREALANATDPCQAFLVDIPAALGCNDLANPNERAGYLQRLREAVHELASCYDALLQRVRDALCQRIGATNSLTEYTEALKMRYASVDRRLLPAKAAEVLDRLRASADNEREFLEKLAYALMDKRLDRLTDAEEPVLLDRLLHVVDELDALTTLGRETDPDDALAFNLRLTAAAEASKPQQTVRLPSCRAAEANHLEQRLGHLLTGDRQLDLAVLLKLVYDRL